MVFVAGVPSVLMVLEGGPGTLSTVREAISKELALSVVIIVESGRAADLLAYAYNNIDSTKIDELINNTDENLLNKVIQYLPELNTEQKQKGAYKEVLDCMKKKKLVCFPVHSVVFIKLLNIFPHFIQLVVYFICL